MSGATPEETALYRVYGEADLLLYIGISNNFGRRWREHAKLQPWWGEKRRLTVDEWYDSRPEAEAVETAAIKAEKPKYNKQHAVPPPPRTPRRAKAPSSTGRRAEVIPELWAPSWLEEITLGPFWRWDDGWERLSSGYRGALRDEPQSSPFWRCAHVHEDMRAAARCAFNEKLKRSRAYVGEGFGQPLTAEEFDRHLTAHASDPAA